MYDLKVNRMYFKDAQGAGGSVILKDNQLTYKHGWRYFVHDEYAYQVASEILTNDSCVIKAFREHQQQRIELTTMVQYVDFDNKKYNHTEDMNKYTWKSDIKDSSVKVNADGSISGTIDQLRKFLSLACNHGRYCRSAYRYESESVKRLMEAGSNYDLYEPYDSFTEYYHGGIVD